MKKTLLLSFLLLIFGGMTQNAWGQTYLIQEGFATTSLPTGWSGDVYFNTTANTGNLTGANGAGFNASNKYLQTPNMNAPGVLTFYMKGSSATSQISMKIQKKVGGADWTDIATYPKPHTNTSTKFTVNINDANNNVAIKFVAYDRTGNSLYLDDIQITQMITEPTTQASSITFDPVGVTSMTVNWTNGNGTGRAVFMKEGSGAITNPSDGTTYTASADWGNKGGQLGSSGYYCIYNGTGTTVELTNLTQSTEYTVQVFEYSGSGTSINYLTSTATGNPNSQTTNAASEPLLTISADPALTELNLDGAGISLELTNDEFKGELANENFRLNNAPAGVTINSVTKNSGNTATLTLAYDGTDFDSDVTTFSITIDNGVLTYSEDPLTGNTLTITAIVETVPTVTTTATITTNGTTTAAWGGEVTSDGGEPVTQKGIVWNTSAEPTIDNNKTEEGAGTGAITGNMTGLTPNTGYYVRAYATNSVGTAYGDQREFTTDNLSAPTANAATDVTKTSFTANWEAVTDAQSYKLDVSEYETFSTVTNATDLFISEYVEGSSNNKAIELFNGTGTSVNLANYSLKKQTNGDGVFGSELVLSGNLENGSAYLIVYNQASSTLLDKADLNSNSSCLSFNGNDAVALYKDGVQIDVVGVIDQVANWGADVTLIRKSNITSPSTTYSADDWDSNPQDYFDNAGSHTYGSASYVTGYENLEVNATNKLVEGLDANTNYYYRVRAYSAASTSSNSSTITVKTAANGQSSHVGAGNNQSANVGNNTGVGSIEFTNVITPGNIVVNSFNNAPANHGLAGNVSNYRWIMGPDNTLVIDEEGGYTLRFEVADCPGVSELEDGNNTSLQLYKRSTPGSGAFEGPIALTYHRNGSNGDQSDDYLVSALITTGFSEFVFNSPTEPLPVELASLTASTVNGNVKLSWQTATEVNNYGFEIERSAVSGQTSAWEKIGFVKGNGNSNSTKNYSFTDNAVSKSGKYAYRLKQVDNDGSFTYSQIVETDVTVNLSYSLGQNYPNPFNPTTKISYSIPETGLVTLKVYNIVGEHVAELVNKTQEAGKYEIEFNGSSLSNGVYFYELKANGFTSVKKLMLLK